MSVKKFCWQLNEAKLGKNDKVWFPRWVRRYASMVEPGGQEIAHHSQNMGKLSVTQEEVIRFLRTLRDNGTPAWQRLPSAP
jgi:hypothetical protein